MALADSCQSADGRLTDWYGRCLATALEFRLLGPLEVWEGERQLRLGGVKQRSVLALLVLDAGRVVSSDRLVDELWGERPAVDSQTALQQHISRLRRLLEPHDVLRTRPSGYVLDVEAESVDLTRFERLSREGYRLLGEGKPAEAGDVLQEALALWRGRPLEDLADEPLARAVSPRLEDARLEALEAHLEARLQTGRHAEVIGELQELVHTHRLRERLRAQLMLALYRSGRQADALDAYAEARRTLVAELGLEPGPELQRLQTAILAHAPELAARVVPGAEARRRRWWLVVAAAGALALLAAVAAAVAIGRDGTGEGVAAVAPGAGVVVAIDAVTGEIRRQIPAGRTPSAIAARDGVVWVVDADAQTVIRLAEGSRVVETFSTGATPTDIAVGAGSVWVMNGRPLENAQFVGPVATAVARLDAATGTERAEIELSRSGGALSNLVENHVAVAGDAVWAVTPDFGVTRIAVASGARTATSRATRVAAVATGSGGVWVLGVDGSVVRLDPRSGVARARVSVPASSIGGLAVGAGAAWVTSPSDGILWRIGGRSPTIGAIELRRGIADVAVGDGTVWVANPLEGTVVQIDAADATVERTIALGGIPRSLALDGDTLWLAVGADPTAATVETRGIRPFPPTVCEPVVRGKSDADVLVISDLALQGGVRTTTTQMAQAIAFVLRRRGFRAGRFDVAYQSCDDSVARTGLFDEPKCAANARAYAGNPDVVGVIGTFNSPCAIAALPELNRAAGGPLAMISPSNSFVGLTRAARGVDPTLPAALYPTGRRNYVRVFPTDDLQGAALALLARRQGHRRVYVLDDGEPGYGVLLANGFEQAARRLGLTVAGRGSWDPSASEYDTLARRVVRSRATAVFVGGLLDTNAGQVVRDLRAALDPSVDLLGPDGLTPLTLLVERAGRAAVGTYVSVAGLVTARLPAGGERFATRFRRAHPGAELEPMTVYAAQAAEVLLDAIARSNGTRASVLRELFRTRVENGLLGSFAFDANGDITESPVTIARVTGRGGSTAVGSVEGGAVVDVVRPSSRLVSGGE